MAMRDNKARGTGAAASHAFPSRALNGFRVSEPRPYWPVIDLFSGCGGMSYGFAIRAPFRLVAAVDAEHAKPCQGFGTLDCNRTYEANIGLAPLDRDIAQLSPEVLLAEANAGCGEPLRRGELTVLLCCPPCTDFSRAKPNNHLFDSPKNSLVSKCADFVDALLPEFVVMENARELIEGNHGHHYRQFASRLRSLGYDVSGGVHMLSTYGLPQIRERAIVVASRLGPARTLASLWDSWAVSPQAITVRRAIGHLACRVLEAGEPDSQDEMHRSPGFASPVTKRRLEAMPRDGGSWFDLANHPEADVLLVNSMKRRLAENDLGSHPDVYGRLAWDRPAATIKRECAHVGNGRYSHPEQDRLLTVREMALLQGFPETYHFVSRALANRYRHIGDAVPPLIAYQLSAIVIWMKTGVRPHPAEWVLPGTSLRADDIARVPSLGIIADRTSVSVSV
jgi:DNA (cytosine-5)-methyltransferase 1